MDWWSAIVLFLIVIIGTVITLILNEIFFKGKKSWFENKHIKRIVLVKEMIQGEWTLSPDRFIYSTLEIKGKYGDREIKFRYSLPGDHGGDSRGTVTIEVILKQPTDTKNYENIKRSSRLKVFRLKEFSEDFFLMGIIRPPEFSLFWNWNKFFTLNNIKEVLKKIIDIASSLENNYEVESKIADWEKISF